MPVMKEPEGYKGAIQSNPGWLYDKGVWVTISGREYEISEMAERYLANSAAFLDKFIRTNKLTINHAKACKEKLQELRTMQRRKNYAN